MGILRKKKKKDEEEKKKKLHMDIDWRLSPGEYLRLMFYGSLLLYAVAWGNFIIASLLYLMAIGGLMVFLFNFHGKNSVRTAKFLPFLVGLFFLLFSFSPKWEGYVMGAYLSTLFINIIGYLLLRADIEKMDSIEGLAEEGVAP